MRVAVRAASWAGRLDSGCSATRCQRPSAASAAARSCSASLAALQPRAGRPGRDRCRRAAGPARPAGPAAARPSRSGRRPAAVPPRTRGCRRSAPRRPPAARLSSRQPSARSTSFEHGQCRTGLEDPAALLELGEHHRTQPVQPAAPRQLGRQLTGVAHHGRADQLDRQPDAEQAEPVEQVLPLQLGQRDQAWAGWRKRSAVSSSSSAASRGARASVFSRAYSASRSVAAAWASSPSTGSTIGHSRRIRGSAS